MQNLLRCLQHPLLSMGSVPCYILHSEQCLCAAPRKYTSTVSMCGGA